MIKFDNHLGGRYSLFLEELRRVKGYKQEFKEILVYSNSI